MRLADFRVLTFDCYGTLIDWEEGLLAALRAWLARREREAPADDALLAAFGEIEPAIQAAEPALPYPDVLARSLRALGEQLRVTVTDADAHAFGASIGDWPAFADTPAALRALARRCRLVVVSNVDRASFARSHTRLSVAFDAVVTAQDVGSYKPAPGHFVRALEIAAGWGVPPAQVLHVAQSRFHDIVPAKALGLATVWVDRRQGRGGGATRAAGSAVEPDWTVTSLAELAARIEHDAAV
jgi:putative hydrolase of the HAD superfamily